MLEATATTAAVERSTGREALDDEDIVRLLSAVDRVIIARGRSRRELTASEVELDALKGPTGKYRAPMLLANRTLLVGFNAEALGELLSR